MTSTNMNSTTQAVFPLFPDFPTELRLKIWKEAVPSPTLDLQRFNAEIVPRSASPDNDRQEGLLLCLTPHDDFVQLTKGHRGLLGACHVSRAIALPKFDCFLPIHYIVRDGEGGPVVRLGKVPFNPDGHLCISGLESAFHAASEGRGARGMQLPTFDRPREVANNINCVSFPMIKNLAFALDPPRDDVNSYRTLPVSGYLAFDVLASRIHEFTLETMGVVDEGWLNERHVTQSLKFERLYKPVQARKFVTMHVDCGVGSSSISYAFINWLQLHKDFVSAMRTFKAIN